MPVDHESSFSLGNGQLRAEALSPNRPRYALLKVILDYGVASVLLIITTPLLLLLMALVRLTSRGPAIYTQERLGCDGRPFTLYKIRTMVQDSERLTGPVWCVPGDPRVTPIGRVLRATHLDELPQLWNVLRGELSLIGPRPERPTIAAELERAIPDYRERLRVRPGVTGLAQVQQEPDTDLNSVRRKLFFDLHYVQHVNLWLDLRILVSTGFYVAGVPADFVGRVFRFPKPAVVEDKGNPIEEVTANTKAQPYYTTS